jgi:4-hydroxy-tetrahydrodipicolinate reductase
MKIAILGRGKTGSKLIDLCHEQNHDTIVFHRDNPFTVEGLKGSEVIISFLPGVALAQYLPILEEARIPVVSASTGHDFSNVKNIAWIQGHNFSLGMNLVHHMINCLQKADKLFNPLPSFAIHEVHHTKKLDAPSGTALSWQRWLGFKANVTSERIGDVVGEHKLTLTTGNETITVQHKAHDRTIFAEGALWSAHYLLTKQIQPGFYWFEDLITQELFAKDT